MLYSEVAEISRVDAAFAFGRTVAKPLQLKFNYSYDKLSDIEGPFLLLSNHTTDYDPIFIGMAYNHPIRFVASEHMAHKGLISKLLIKYFNPILFQKGKLGIGTTKEMIKSVKAGDCVGLFPEGGRSFNGETGKVLDSTARLVKTLKTKLVTVKLIGGYEVQPRWGVKLNKGKIQLKLVNVYSVDEIKAMSDEELTEKINSDIYVKADVPKDLTGIESALFMASPEEIGPDMDIAALDKKQKAFVDSGAADFSDEVDLFKVGEDHTPRFIKKILLRANAAGFSFDGEPVNPSGAALISRNTLILHDGPVHYEIKGPVKFSALKYMYQYNYLLQRKE